MFGAIRDLIKSNTKVKAHVLPIVENSSSNSSDKVFPNKELLFGLEKLGTSKITKKSYLPPIEFPYSSRKFYEITFINSKFSDNFDIFRNDLFTAQLMKLSSDRSSYLKAVCDFYITGVSLPSNFVFSEVQTLFLPHIGILHDAVFNKSRSFGDLEILNKMQVRYNKLHFGNAECSQLKNVHQFQDPDSSKASLGTIVQKKAALVLDRFGSPINIEVQKPPKGHGADFLLSSGNECLYVDVKLLRSDFIKMETPENLKIVNHNGYDVHLNVGRIVDLISYNLAQPPKNTNPVLFLAVDGYPSSSLLNQLKEYQHELNNEILPILKEKSLIHPNSKVYFCFVGVIPEKFDLPISEVSKFNLSILTEFPDINESVIEEVVRTQI